MNVGGQAVLEGVMMRTPSSWSVSVRRADGEVETVSQPVTSVAARRRWLRLPVIRGVVALGESLVIGFRALAISAHYAARTGAGYSASVSDLAAVLEGSSAATVKNEGPSDEELIQSLAEAIRRVEGRQADTESRVEQLEKDRKATG